MFVIPVGSMEACRYFNLFANYQALSNNRTLENLVEGVLLNESHGTIELYFRPLVLQNKPYLNDQLFIKLRELAITSFTVMIPSLQISYPQAKTLVDEFRT